MAYQRSNLTVLVCLGEIVQAFHS